MNIFNVTKLNSYTYFATVAIYIFCVTIFVNYIDLYFYLAAGEMALIELLGAFSLLVASVVLIMSAIKSNREKEAKYKRVMLFSAGVLFFLAAGEEISWGQHMFGTVTPDWLVEINAQDETNVHNINKKFFDRLLERGTILITLITAIFHLRGKEHLFGFKLPEYPLNFSFMLLPFLKRFEVVELDVWSLTLIPFLIYFCIAIKEKNRNMLITCCSFIITGLIVIYFHHVNAHTFATDQNIYNEYRETVFSLLCIIFSVQLYKNIVLNK